MSLSIVYEVMNWSFGWTLNKWSVWMFKRRNSMGNILYSLTPSSLQTNVHIFKNSADPDETARNKPSHQDLQCLPICYWFLTKSLIATMDVTKFGDGRVHLINSGVKGLTCQPNRGVAVKRLTPAWWAGGRSQFRFPPGPTTFFRGYYSWNIFYGHSVPSADSRRAAVSFWQKIVHKHLLTA